MIDYADYDRKTQWQFRNDKRLIAKENGYSYISEMIDKEYKKLKSMAKVAKKTGTTFTAVRFHLLRMGSEIRPQGGNNNVRR